MTTIDIPLLKLQYEILNISLDQLAQEVNVPKSILEQEARNNNWTQWWPDTEPQFTIGLHIPDGQEDDEFLTPLEEGSQAFLKQTRVRLQVFNLAKEVYLTHKYASFEAALLAKAKDIVGTAATAQELSSLSNILKNLVPPSKAAHSLTLGQSDDGIPSVIIRDLTGRKL